MLRRNKVNKLLGASALFFAGWFSCQWLGDDESFWTLWTYAAYCLSLATMIEGSWRILPMMAIGFCIAEAGIWALFYFAGRYHPGSEELSLMIAFGCVGATLVGARWLIRSRRLVTTPPVGMTCWIPLLCFGVALFAAGVFARGISSFSVNSFAPEPAAMACALICSLAIWTAASSL